MVTPSFFVFGASPVFPYSSPTPPFYSRKLPKDPTKVPLYFLASGTFFWYTRYAVSAKEKPIKAELASMGGHLPQSIATDGVSESSAVLSHNFILLCYRQYGQIT